MWNRRLSNAIDDPAEYQHLTDCVLREIESSKDPGMAKAQGIVRDIRTRNLYKFVDEHLLPQEEINRIPKVRPADTCAARCVVTPACVGAPRSLRRR